MFTNNNIITSFKELIYFVNLKTLGRYFVYGCSALTVLYVPSTVTTIGNGAFQGAIRLRNLRFYPDSAPSLGSNAFGSTTVSTATGYNTRNEGTNEFHVPVDATGYNSGLYSSRLQNVSYCGFTVIYDL